MIFCFVDESDNKIEYQGEKVYYSVLAGILIHSDFLFDLSFKLEEFKGLYKIENLKEIRKDKGKKFKNINDIIKELVNALGVDNVKILSVIDVLNPKQKYNEKMREEMYYNNVKLLAERVTLHCELERNHEKWLFIGDSVSYKDELIKELKHRIKEWIATEGKAFSLKIKDYLFETPFFVNDELSSFIQIADLVASAVNRAWKGYLNKYLNNYGIASVNNNTTLKEDLDSLINSEFLKPFSLLFLRDSDGKINGRGLKVWNFNG